MVQGPGSAGKLFERRQAGLPNCRGGSLPTDGQTHVAREGCVEDALQVFNWKAATGLHLSVPICWDFKGVLKHRLCWMSTYPKIHFGCMPGYVPTCTKDLELNASQRQLKLWKRRIVWGSARGRGGPRTSRSSTRCWPPLTLRVWADSSAALGVCTRSGWGKLRHIDTQTLWVQNKVRLKAFDLRKVRRTNMQLTYSQSIWVPAMQLRSWCRCMGATSGREELRRPPPPPAQDGPCEGEL